MQSTHKIDELTQVCVALIICCEVELTDIVRSMGIYSLRIYFR